MILLCYDGSDHARAAVDRAAKLFPHGPVTVLTIWEPYIQVMAESAFGAGYFPPADELEQIDQDIRERATETAREGAERARHAGLASEPRVAARGATVAATILEVADEIDAAAIIVGTRGLGGVKSVLLGSVSHGVVQRSHRPVLVVPSGEPPGEG